MARRATIPVAINLFGSERRICLALGVERLDDIGDRIAEMVNLKVPEGLLAKLAMLPRLAELAKFPPRTIRAGRRARRWSGAATRSTSTGCRSCRPGRVMAAATSRCRW